METEYLYETPLNTHKQYVLFIYSRIFHKNINYSKHGFNPKLMLYTHLIHDYKHNDFNTAFDGVEGLRL